MNYNLNAENINYIKIHYEDNDGFTHVIKTAVRFTSEYEILTSIKTPDKPDIKIPKEVFIQIVTENGVYKANTTLKRIEKEDPYYLLSLSRPNEMEYQQKREFFRVKLQENVKIENDETTISAITYDISGNGVRIELDEKIEFPPEVTLTLFLQKRTIKVKAKYIRSDNEDDILKASFNFIDLSEQDSNYIIQTCFKKQLEDRRKR